MELSQHRDGIDQLIYSFRKGEKLQDELVVPIGYLLMVGSFLFCAGSLYTIVLSKVLPDFDNLFLDAIKHDHYYCYLIPACIPVTMIFIYFNWLSLKFFRHN